MRSSVLLVLLDFRQRLGTEYQVRKKPELWADKAKLFKGLSLFITDFSTNSASRFSQVSNAA